MIREVADHLACPLLKADHRSIGWDPKSDSTDSNYAASMSRFLKDASEWDGLVLFDGNGNPAAYGCYKLMLAF
jgi:hypothetical protein